MGEGRDKTIRERGKLKEEEMIGAKGGGIVIYHKCNM